MIKAEPTRTKKGQNNWRERKGARKERRKGGGKEGK